AANAAHFPAPKEGYWIARDFHFHTGEVFPEVRLHYRTIGKPEGVPIVVLHGTGSSGQSMSHSPENCSDRASRSMPKRISSYSPMRSVRAIRQSRRMG